MRSFVLLLLFPFSSSAAAAPPTLTSLFPAGGQRGTIVEVNAGGVFDGSVQGWASNKGTAIKPGKAKGTLSVTVGADVPAGVHWLRLFNAEGASEQRPFVVGTLPEVSEVDPNDDVKKPQVLAGNCVVNGKLNPAGDVDHFAVDLKNGQTLVASLEANFVLRSPMDGHLQLLDAAGFVVAENNDTHGLDPQIVYTVPKDGRYVVRVFAFPSAPDSSIRFFGSELCIYRLTVTTGGFADHAFPPAVSLKDPGAIEFLGWNIPAPAKKLMIKPDRLTDRLSVTHAEIANAVGARVEPHPCIVEIEPNDLANPQQVATPITIGGHIQTPGDIDVFQFTLKKGERRTIQVEVLAINSPLDPVVRLLDESGKMLNEARTANNSEAPEIAFTAPADGKYRVEIRDLYKHGGERYVYRLRVAAIEPDFSLSLAADQITLNAGESLEIPVTINRLNGFAQPIEIRVPDLPMGLTCEPVKADAAAKAVKLKLSAKNAVGGPIRVVGIAGFERTARATIATFGTTTESIWITARPAKK